MKKMIYLVVLAATFSLATSCKGKDKEAEPEEEPDMTYVVPAQVTFIS